MTEFVCLGLIDNLLDRLLCGDAKFLETLALTLRCLAKRHHYLGQVFASGGRDLCCDGICPKKQLLILEES
jgi:hypothetical protein